MTSREKTLTLCRKQHERHHHRLLQRSCLHDPWTQRRSEHFSTGFRRAWAYRQCHTANRMESQRTRYQSILELASQIACPTEPHRKVSLKRRGAQHTSEVLPGKIPAELCPRRDRDMDCQVWTEISLLVNHCSHPSLQIVISTEERESFDYTGGFPKGLPVHPLAEGCHS